MSHEHRPGRSNDETTSSTGGSLLTGRQLETRLQVHNGWAAKNRLGLTAAPVIPFIRIGRSCRYAPGAVEKALAQMTNNAAA